MAEEEEAAEAVAVMFGMILPYPIMKERNLHFNIPSHFYV